MHSRIRIHGRWGSLVIATALVLLSSLPALADLVLPRTDDGPAVVLLHGLIRSGRSMGTMSDALEEAGYRVCNINYPSRHHSIASLAAEYVAPAVSRCFPNQTAPIAFVTHSMGGIIVRQLAVERSIPSLGRVVMLGPPNAGSALVDKFQTWWLFRKINGPAGLELGTTLESTPRRLGPANFEVGIIAGTRSQLWSRYLEGPNDGKVSIESAALEGMKDFVEVDENHTFIMRNDEAISQTIRFLRDGTFAHTIMVASDDEAPAQGEAAAAAPSQTPAGVASQVVAPAAALSARLPAGAAPQAVVPSVQILEAAAPAS